MKEKSYAKINLTLDITGVLPNGYHSLCSVMHSVNLYDIVTVTMTKTGTIEIKTNVSFIPTDRKNHAYRAAELFFEETGIKNEGILIEIEKNIPVCAGLAGGSSNAAAVLKILNQCYETKLSVEQLCKIGYRIGADVPYCIHGGTMLAEGIGEKLTPLPSLPEIPIVLAKPRFGVSTPQAFQQWDKINQPEHPDTLKMIEAIKNKDLHSIGLYLSNTLEAPSFEIIEKTRKNPIPEIKRSMMQCGALGTLMSGSGPTVFGLFPLMEQAEIAAEHLKTMVDDVFVTTT